MISRSMFTQSESLPATFTRTRSHQSDDGASEGNAGIRSAAVAEYLRSRGFARAVNLAGGLDQWAQTVDPSMKRY